MDDSEIEAYLDRIGAQRPGAPDLAALRALQRAHLFSVPFENLSIHLDEPITLDEPALLAKIVDRHRGGFCYELNGAFAALLTALGYRVTLLEARVASRAGYGPPFDHLALRVDLDEPWLVDVGFGAFSHAPLRLESRDKQKDAAGEFQLADAKGRPGEVDVTMNGKPEYRLDLRPYELRDFEPTCWWQQTSPQSHFTRSLTCSLPTEAGRVTLSGNKLIVTRDGERTQRTLEDSELLTAYKQHFGITLDRVPRVADTS